MMLLDCKFKNLWFTRLFIQEFMVLLDCKFRNYGLLDC